MRISLNPNRSTGRPTSGPHQIAKNLKAPSGSFSDRLDFGKIPSRLSIPTPPILTAPIDPLL